MNIENLNISLNGETPKEPIEIIIREGKVPEPIALKDKNTMLFIGGPETPASIAIAKKQLITKNTVVIVEAEDSSSPKITIEFDPEDQYGAKAVGEILINPVLKQFHFNTNPAFDNKSFINVIKENAHVFDSLEIAQKLIKSLQNFKAKIETELIDKDDKKGNTDVSIMTRLKREESGIPEELKITLPILKSGKEVKLSAEVEIEIKGTTILFGFYSLEISKLKRDAIKAAIESELAKIAELNLPIIYK